MSGRVGVEQTPDIEAVLAEHEYMLQNSRGSICRCGFVPTVDADSLKTQQDYHRAHVADRLAAAVREARAAELREAADGLAQFALTDFDACGPKSLRGASIWDSAQWLKDRADHITELAPHEAATSAKEA